MRVLLTKASFDFGLTRVAVNYGRSKGNPAGYRFFRRPGSLHKPVFIKASTGEQHDRDLAKFSMNLRNIHGWFSNASPLEEMPQVVVKAKLILEERLLRLFRNTAFKWCLALLLGCSFASDVLMAVSVNRELLIPLGLFVGITLADVFKESFQDIPAMGGNDEKQLWGIGLFFVALRIVFLRFRMPGWILFAHIGNGGLMQILWPLKEPQQPDIAQINEELDSLRPPSI